LEDVVGLEEVDFARVGCSPAEARFLLWVRRGFDQRPPLFFKLV
jgi:hypothetical protein